MTVIYKSINNYEKAKYSYFQRDLNKSTSIFSVIYVRIDVIKMIRKIKDFGQKSLISFCRVVIGK